MKRLISIAMLVAVASLSEAQTFPPGTHLRLTAIPAAGASFVGWSGDVTTLAQTIDVTITEDTAIVATFTADAPPPPPQDPTLTITVVGQGSVTVEVFEETEPPPPPPSGDYAASVSCPDGSGNYIATTTIPNDPLGDGCIATPMDESVFFTGTPYGCATLKTGLFYTGAHAFAAGERLCQDVTTPEEFKLTQSFNGTQQMVAIIHNDLTITAGSEIPWLAAKGEMLVIGIPDTNGRSPRFIHASHDTIFNWQVTSGNLALVNVIDPGMVQFGSAQNTQQSTLTMVGVTHQSVSRLVLTRFEGGNSPNDPTLPIDDEVYLKNVLTRDGPNSHNVYLDRNGLQYVEGLVSYGNRADANHALKMDGRLGFMYGSYLSSAGVHGNLPDDNSGQAPFSGVACQQGVYKDNKFLNAINVFGGAAAAQAQIRTAIAGCDYPQGYLSNTYPTRAYTGPLSYRGVNYASTPFWDESWWQSVQAAGTTPPQVYSNPDMLVMYWMGNTFETLNNGSSTTTNYHGIHSDPTFPAGYPSMSQTTTPRFTDDKPPNNWFERTRHVLVNSCFVSGNPNKALNHWPGRMNCADSDTPAWLSSYHACATGGVHPDETDKFIRVGANECGIEDTVPPEVGAAIAALEAIPNPPWRHWK